MLTGVTIEINGNGTLNINFTGRNDLGTWKLTSTTNNTVVIELTQQGFNPRPVTVTITVVSRDRIRWLQKGNVGGKDQELVLKRL
jgi:hypothetical protein